MWWLKLLRKVFPVIYLCYYCPSILSLAFALNTDCRNTEHNHVELLNTINDISCGDTGARMYFFHSVGIYLNLCPPKVF